MARVAPELGNSGWATGTFLDVGPPATLHLLATPPPLLSLAAVVDGMGVVVAEIRWFVAPY